MPIIDPMDKQPISTIVDPFDDKVILPPKSPASMGEFMQGTFSDVLPAMGKSLEESYKTLKEGFTGKGEQGVLGGTLKTGKGLLEIPSAIPKAIGAGIGAFGAPAMATTEHAIGSVIAPEMAARDRPEEMKQKASKDIQTALMGVGAKGGLPKNMMPTTPKPVIPTQEELSQAAVAQGYKGGVMDVPLKDHVLPDIQANIHDELHAQHFRDYLAPQVFRAIKELEPVKGQQPTVADIEGVRQILGRVAPQERAAATIARNKINEYLSEIQPHDTMLGENVGAVLSSIRGNYAALKRSELITNASEEGQRAAQSSGMGANLDNALRQQIKRIRKNPKLTSGMDKDVLEQMDKIIKGGTLTNLARIFSRFGPEHPLTGWGMAGIEGLKHMRLLPLLQLAGGHMAQKYAEHSTQKLIKELDEMVRSKSPLFHEKNPSPQGDVQSYLNQNGL